MRKVNNFITCLNMKQKNLFKFKNIFKLQIKYIMLNTEIVILAFRIL